MKTNTKTPIIPFILVTFLFFAWGVANNMTEPLISAFKGVFKDMSHLQSTLVQVAFYLAYFVWAIPAALLIKKTNYKTTIMLGLVLYALGAYLFIPASQVQEYSFFLLALFTVATGISFLETAANPYIIAMGDEQTAVQRLNLAQSFNPIGAYGGTLIATYAILENLTSDAEKQGLSATALAELQSKELGIIAQPYVYMSIVLIIFAVIFALVKMPAYKDESIQEESFFTIFGRILKKRRYSLSVIALFTAMCAQFGTMAFTIPYLLENFREAGELVNKGRAGELLSYGILLFAIMRFVCTGLMKFITPAKLLGILSALGTALTVMAIVFPGNFGGICLILVCGCVALLFPTIYGLGLQGLSEEETKVGASGLIMTIIAIAIMNPVQGAVIDATSVSLSYICTVMPFVYLITYGFIIDKFSNHNAH